MRRCSQEPPVCCPRFVENVTVPGDSPRLRHAQTAHQLRLKLDDGFDAGLHARPDSSAARRCRGARLFLHDLSKNAHARLDRLRRQQRLSIHGESEYSCTGRVVRSSPRSSQLTFQFVVSPSFAALRTVQRALTSVSTNSLLSHDGITVTASSRTDHPHSTLRKAEEPSRVSQRPSRAKRCSSSPVSCLMRQPCRALFSLVVSDRDFSRRSPRLDNVSAEAVCSNAATSASHSMAWSAAITAGEFMSCECMPSRERKTC